jgi:hypothetical protein
VLSGELAAGAAGRHSASAAHPSTTVARNLPDPRMALTHLSSSTKGRWDVTPTVPPAESAVRGSIARRDRFAP